LKKGPDSAQTWRRYLSTSGFTSIKRFSHQQYLGNIGTCEKPCCTVVHLQYCIYPVTGRVDPKLGGVHTLLHVVRVTVRSKFYQNRLLVYRTRLNKHKERHENILVKSGIRDETSIDNSMIMQRRDARSVAKVATSPHSDRDGSQHRTV
jgi:hypothetical protein